MFLTFFRSAPQPYIYIYFALSVCLSPINVKTAEPIGPKFCVGPHMTGQREDLWRLKIFKISLQQNSIFIQF